MRNFFQVAVVAASLLVVTACGSDSKDDAAPVTTAPAASAGPATDVALSDFMIMPHGFNVKAGAVTFKVHNDGKTPHNFFVETTDGKKVGGTKTLNEGQSETVTMQIPAGTYTVICLEAGHDSLGMKDTLISA